MLMLVILVAGVIFAITLQREMFPESRPDKLMVSAVYPGVQPEDIEKAVTIKVEEALRGLEGIEKIESQVAEGISFTTLTLSQWMMWTLCCRKSATKWIPFRTCRKASKKSACEKWSRGFR